MLRLYWHVWLIACLSIGASGQSPAGEPRFEVASVKPNRTRVRSSIDFAKGGERFTATNTPLGALIIIAYDVTVRQLSGPQGPLSERYDIAATTERPVKAGDMLPMLRALLAERFHLVVRRETRDVPVLALTVAKGGPKTAPRQPAGERRAAASDARPRGRNRNGRRSPDL